MEPEYININTLIHTKPPKRFNRITVLYRAEKPDYIEQDYGCIAEPNKCI